MPLEFPKPHQTSEAGKSPERKTKPFIFEEVISAEPVHGIGEGNRMTPEEVRELGIVLEACGADLDYEPLKHIRGEGLKDMLDYVRAEPFSPKRDASRARIKEHIREANKVDMADSST